jgi:hypothetical protein
MTDATHTAQEVVAASGITYRQLDYWERIDVISAAQQADGSGTRRGYSDADLEALLVIGRVVQDLRDIGVADTQTPVGLVKLIWDRVHEENRSDIQLGCVSIHVASDPGPPLPIQWVLAPNRILPAEPPTPCGSERVLRWVEGNEAKVVWCDRTTGGCKYPGASRSRSGERSCNAGYDDDGRCVVDVTAVIAPAEADRG